MRVHQRGGDQTPARIDPVVRLHRGRTLAESADSAVLDDDMAVGVLGLLLVDRGDGGMLEHRDGHGCAAVSPAVRAPAWRTASRIFSYPVQRHRFPARASRISSSAGSGLRFTRSCAATTRPGVQKPHCTAPHSTKDSCTVSSWSPSASPSTVRTSRPSTWPAATMQEHAGTPSRYTVHEPHSPCSQAFFEPASPSRSRRTYSRLAPSHTPSAASCCPLTVTFTRMRALLPGDSHATP